MENSKITSASRILLVVCGLALLLVLFLPLWRIDLNAPQYPEGLRLLIHTNKLAGNVDIINGLNHYIGMKTLHTDDFIEFKMLPWIIVSFSILLILATIIARRKALNIVFILFLLFGVVAMIDFWRWEYNYGHHLDPNAAIIVPGMAYQPPLIGFKQLLNFGAYSIPDIGGWIFVSVGVVLLAIVFYEWKRHKQVNAQTAAVSKVLLASLLFSVTGCGTTPEPIVLNKDHCTFCKMPIGDDRFGAEIVTTKTRTFKFDDPHCIVAYINTGSIDKNEIAAVYFTNFVTPHELIHVDNAQFLQSPDFKSPMNGNIAAFNNDDSLANALHTFYGNKISWEEMLK